MAGANLEQSDALEPSARIERLEKRLQRERSARKEAEAIAEQGMRDLYLANRDLDRQVSERTLQLETEMQASAKAAEERLRFLGALSRQVRTPLNGVSGMLELLQNQDIDEQSMIWLGSAATSAQELLTLFSRLALYTELSDLRNEPQRAHAILPTLNDFAAQWGQKLLLKGQLLVTEFDVSGVSVMVSADRFKQLLNEVFDNVQEHGSPGALHFRAVHAGSSVVVEVQDSGPGITAEGLRYGADASEVDFTETLGMGYAIMTRLCEATGTSIEQAITDDSTIMRITLPIAGEANE